MRSKLFPSKPLPFRISYDTEELTYPRSTKMTPDEAFEIFRKERRLGFVAYLEDGESESTTLLTQEGRQLQNGPKENWDWGSVEFIGAGTIEARGSSFDVVWSNSEAIRRFGRSHPSNFDNYCRADEQVKKDFAEFLAMQAK